jgi:hypothetical protein
MKLTKHLPWLLAGFPVAAIIGFSLWSNHAPSARPPAPKTVSTPAVSNPKQQDSTSFQYAADGSQIKQPSLAEIAARKRYLEAKQRADEAKERRVDGFKKTAEKYTPEFRTRVADGFMKRRDPDYQKIFASWNLDAQTIPEALAIIREREIGRLVGQGNYLKDSSSLSSVKEKSSNDQTENLVAQEQLSLLLGESRANELLNSIKQLEKNELADAALELRGRK